ncbi:MAG: CAP domain-containing protein [Lachnospiraceae bacterium]|nr:CAP domain-containing protein [Lachnospiraceae bacterium]
MKIKKVTLLLFIVLIFSGSNSEGDETPVCSFALKSEATEGNDCVGEETGKAAGSIENIPELEGKFIGDRTKNEEESAVKAPESAEEPSIDLCVGLAKEIFEQTNAEREIAGLEPLKWSNELAEFANIRADEIITNFSHVRNDDTKCYILSDLIYGENIARGPHATGAEFLAHWMDSEGHKENILNPQYTTIGIGTSCTEQGDTAVQLFGIN